MENIQFKERKEKNKKKKEQSFIIKNIQQGTEVNYLNIIKAM